MNIAIINTTKLQICPPKRIKNNKQNLVKSHSLVSKILNGLLKKSILTCKTTNC